ncbi:efflux RND transporter periplasmic adaptor subunit [bacterium SCSIO 12741]|nr:efflux RND transporter periplasmic adaptor subunit [bacterium SCSIO 12741]
MKNLVWTAVMAVLIASCAPQAGEGELSQLQHERDSLKKVKGEIADRLAVIEGEIAELDSTKKLTLVTAEKPAIQNFRHYFKVYGEVETDQNTQIFPEIGGTILAIMVKEGDRVNKGQALLRIDTEILDEQIKEVETRLELAETTYQKQKKLWDKNIGSEMQFLQAKNNRDALATNLEALKAQKGKAIVQAPFSGVIDEIVPKVGESAMPGAPLMRIINLSNMYVTADISESYIGKVKQGDHVMVEFTNYGVEHESTIARTGEYINPNNRTFQIKVNLDNSDGLYKPNMVARINVMDYSKDSVVVLPTRLILEGSGGRRYVFALEKGSEGVTAVKRQVEVAKSYRGMAEISKGLTGDEWIVSKGARAIRDGQFVEWQQ